MINIDVVDASDDDYERDLYPKLRKVVEDYANNVGILVLMETRWENGIQKEWV